MVVASPGCTNTGMSRSHTSLKNGFVSFKTFGYAFRSVFEHSNSLGDVAPRLREVSEKNIGVDVVRDGIAHEFELGSVFLHGGEIFRDALGFVHPMILVSRSKRRYFSRIARFKPFTKDLPSGGSLVGLVNESLKLRQNVE